jgi:hypothetical protein
MKEEIFFGYLGVDELIILKCIKYSDKATDWTVRDSKLGRDKRHPFSKTPVPSSDSTQLPIQRVTGIPP